MFLPVSMIPINCKLIMFDNQSLFIHSCFVECHAEKNPLKITRVIFVKGQSIISTEGVGEQINSFKTSIFI